MEIVAGYKIIREEEYCPGHWVCLGVRGKTGMAVTWERTAKDNYFWGHYFANETDARIDYHKRLARLIEERA